MDFVNVAKQCLTQAFNIIYEIDKELSYFEDELDSNEDVWKFHLGDLNTSHILLYQGIEALMKATICEESPLLLLDTRVSDWPTLPDSKNKEFNQLSTISGKSLLKVYFSVGSPSNPNTDIPAFVEEIRLIRNKIIHGISREYLSPKFLINSILKTHTYFIGKDSWWLTMRELYINYPLFGIYKSDYEEVGLIEKLYYLEKILEPSEWRKHFSLDFKSRRYYCPWCTFILEVEKKYIQSKWALLIPQNQQRATEIKCLNCQRSHSVVRRKCSNDKCAGDVLHRYEDNDYECLTCQVHQ